MKGLTTRDLYMLDEACRIITTTFPKGCCYLVGSAEQSEYLPRDVDVRLILSDDEFDRLYKYDDGWDVNLWQLMSLTICEYLRSRTGLPIDFQIQRQTIANEKHDHPRNPLGLKGGARQYAGGGDGTDWTDRFLNKPVEE